MSGKHHFHFPFTTGSNGDRWKWGALLKFELYQPQLTPPFVSSKDWF